MSSEESSLLYFPPMLQESNSNPLVVIVVVLLLIAVISVISIIVYKQYRKKHPETTQAFTISCQDCQQREASGNMTLNGDTCQEATQKAYELCQAHGHCTSSDKQISCPLN